MEIKIIYFLTLIFQSVDNGFSQQYVEQNDLALTFSQKRILDKLRKRISPLVPREYMREEIYLIRWLKAANFDLDTAEEMLMRNFKWRKQKNMDYILEEDFSDMIKEYSPIYVDFVDKKGQPVVSSTIWNFRKAQHSGKSDRLIRFIMRAFEKAAQMIRESEKNATRFNYILNLEGFNVFQHGCPPCMITYVRILRSYRRYWPEMIDRLIFINAPSTVNFLLRPITLAFLNHNRVNTINLKIFGRNKKEWAQYLLQFIDENELVKEYGGKKARSNSSLW